MDYCECGRVAKARCTHCERALCEVHAVGRMPYEVVNDPVMRAQPEREQEAFRRAWGDDTTVQCLECRKVIADAALLRTRQQPMLVLPGHYLDRKVALATDSTRSSDAHQTFRLPRSVSLVQLIADFISRAVPRVPIHAQSFELRRFGRSQEIRGWWFSDARCSTFKHSWNDLSGTTSGDTETLCLPLFLTLSGERLGPSSETELRRGSKRVHRVPDDDVDVEGLFGEMSRMLAWPDLPRGRVVL
jgi:hypothetical protein